MNTIKQIKKLRRKTCTIRVAEDTSKEKGFWGEVRDLNGDTLHQTPFQYTAEDALELAKDYPNVLPENQRHSVKMSEQQRRDEKNGLYGGREDVAN